MNSRTSAWIELDAAWKSVDNLKNEINKFQQKVDNAEKHIKEAKKFKLQRKTASLSDENVNHRRSQNHLQMNRVAPSEIAFSRAKKRKVIRNVQQPQYTSRTNNNAEIKDDSECVPLKHNSFTNNEDSSKISAVAPSENVPVIELSPVQDINEEIIRPHTINDEKALLDLAQSKSTPFFTSRFHSAILKGNNNGIQPLRVLIESQRIAAKETVQSSPASQDHIPVRRPLRDLSLQEQLHLDVQSMPQEPISVGLSFEELSTHEERLSEHHNVSRKIAHAQNPVEYRGFALHGTPPAAWVTPSKRKRSNQQKKSVRTPLFRPMQKKIAKIKRNDTIISTSSWKEGRKLVLQKLKKEGVPSASLKPVQEDSSIHKEAETSLQEKLEREEINKRLTELFTVKKRRKTKPEPADTVESQEKAYDINVVRGFIKNKREERRRMLKEENDHRFNLLLKKKQGLRNLDNFCRKRLRKPHPTADLQDKYETSKQLWGEKFVPLGEVETNEIEPDADVSKEEPVLERRSSSEILPTVQPNEDVNRVSNGIVLDNATVDPSEKQLKDKSSHLKKLKLHAKEIEAVIESETDHIQKLVDKSTEIEGGYFGDISKTSSNYSVKKRKKVKERKESEEKIKKNQFPSHRNKEPLEFKHSNSSLQKDDEESETQPKEFLQELKVLHYDPFNFISVLNRKKLVTRSKDVADEDAKRIDRLFEFLHENQSTTSQDVNRNISSWLREVIHSANETNREISPSEHQMQESNSNYSLKNVSQKPAVASRSLNDEIAAELSTRTSPIKSSSKLSIRQDSDSKIMSVNNNRRKTKEYEKSNSSSAFSSLYSVSEKLQEEEINSSASSTGNKSKNLHHSSEKGAKNGSASLSSARSGVLEGSVSLASSSVRTRSSKSKQTSQVQTDDSIRTASSQSRSLSSSVKSSSLRRSESQKDRHNDHSSASSISEDQHSHATTVSTVTENDSNLNRNSQSRSMQFSTGDSSRTSSSRSKSKKRKARVQVKTSGKIEKPQAEGSILSRQMQNEISCLDFLSDQLLCISELNVTHATELSSISHLRFRDSAVNSRQEDSLLLIRESLTHQEDSYKQILESIRERHQEVLDRAVVDAKTLISHAASSILQQTTKSNNETYSSDFDQSSHSRRSSVREEIAYSVGSNSVLEVEPEYISPEPSSVSEKLGDSSPSSDITKKLEYHLSDATKVKNRVDSENKVSEEREPSTVVHTETIDASGSSGYEPEKSDKREDDYTSEMKRLTVETWKEKLAKEKIKIAGLNLIKKKLEQQGDDERARMILKMEKRSVRKMKEDRDAMKSISSGTVATSRSNTAENEAETAEEVSSKIEEQPSSSVQDSIQEAINTSAEKTIDEKLSPVIESTNASIATDYTSQVPSVSSQKTSTTAKNVTSSKSNRSRRGSLSLRLRSHPFMQDSSVSDESVNVSRFDTVSDYTDLEVRVYALKEELRQRKSVAERLKSELKKKHRERLKKKEESLKKQIEAYDYFIQQTTEELNREIEASSSQTVGVVKPKICQPSNFEHRQERTSSSSVLSASFENQNSKYEDTFTGSKTSEVHSTDSAREKFSSVSKSDAVAKSVATSEVIVETSSLSGSIRSEFDASLPSEDKSAELTTSLSVASTEDQESTSHDGRSVDKTDESFQSEENDGTFPAATVLSIREENVENESTSESQGDTTSIESFISSAAVDGPIVDSDFARKKESIAEQISEGICIRELDLSLEIVKEITANREESLKPPDPSVTTQRQRKENAIDCIVWTFVDELVSSSISRMVEIRRQRRIADSDDAKIDERNNISKKVTSILAVLNDKKPQSKCRPQDLMVISSVENEVEWSVEKTDGSTIQVSNTLQIEEPEWFDDDIGLGLSPQQQIQQHPPPPAHQQQTQQFPSYYYRTIPDKPPPPYSPVRVSEAPPPELAWSIPRTSEETNRIVVAAAQHLFRVQKNVYLEDADPTGDYLDSNLNINKLEAASQRAFNHFLFDLAKETALETFSYGETAEEPWVKPKRLTKKPRVPDRCEEFVEMLQYKMQQNLSYLLGKCPVSSTGKFANRQRERVGLIVLEEMQREEQDWVNYNDDEVAVKYQVAEDVFNFLLDDALTPITKTTS